MPQKPKPLDDTTSLRAWFGVELRNWRTTRGLSTGALAAKAQISGSTIERIEKAERSCNPDLAGRLDEALDAGGALRRLWRRVQEETDSPAGDADNVRSSLPETASDQHRKGMLHRDPLTRPDGSPPVHRRTFLTTSGIAALLPLSRPADPPKTVRPEDIEQVRLASTTHSDWANRYGGGGFVREASISQLKWATSLLDVACPPALRNELFTAVGRLAIGMGASAFDAYEHDDARRLLSLGVYCAEAADNWHLRANALNWSARQAIWCGQPQDGLTFADQGLVRADRLTPREQAMLHNARARAWAKMHHRQQTLIAIGTSDDVFSNAQHGEDPPWMSYYDHAQHHGDTGHALFDIALLPGQSTQAAIERLQTAMIGHTPAYLRSRALSGTKLATLTMATGDPDEALAIADHALNEVGQLRSKRAIDDIQDLARAATPYRRNPQIAALRKRITRTVQA
ncbi:helix-turn-helix transcriptional regulator [Streptomyces sp. NPDC088124]|uniref:helix-turn-helix domain-containing protein n=1 Tax=Streptomyces sp. NPDC088124 TaxID=3154654 RepID=UPI0034360D48